LGNVRRGKPKILLLLSVKNRPGMVYVNDEGAEYLDPGESERVVKSMTAAMKHSRHVYSAFRTALSSMLDLIK
jgi:hypothetical protein